MAGVYTTPKLPGLSEAMISVASSTTGWSALFGRCKRQRRNRGAIDIGSHIKGLPLSDPQRDLKITEHRPTARV